MLRTAVTRFSVSLPGDLLVQLDRTVETRKLPSRSAAITEMIRQGLKTLRMSGLTKIMEGVTTPEEVLRVSVADA